jgi:hypothetical protein
MKAKASLFLITILSVIACSFCSPNISAAAEAAKIKVLLVTGDDVSPAHNWFEVSQAVREVLLASGKFDVKICEDAGVLDSAAALDRYDLVFLQFYNAKAPTLSDSGKANLLKFVSGGKGFAVSHLSSASFKEWDEFKKLCGRYWVMGKSGHGPRSVFKAKVTNRTHRSRRESMILKSTMSSMPSYRGTCRSMSS